MLTPSTEVDEGRLRIEKCADDFGVNELNEWIVGCVGFYFVGLVRYRVGSRHAYGALVSLGVLAWTPVVGMQDQPSEPIQSIQQALMAEMALEKSDHLQAWLPPLFRVVKTEHITALVKAE